MNSTDDAVYELLRKIPEGKVTTYGEIAKVLGLPTPRMVGRILHRNPDQSKNPCHRVVFSDGSLTPGFAFGGLEVQKDMLLNEGVKFKGDKVNMTECGYKF